MWKRIMIGLAAVLVVAAVAFWAGPRVDTTFRPKPLAIPNDLDAYLARSEAVFTDLVPGTEKRIIWANADHAKTPVAFVYLHGFSATRQETYPLCDRVARHFGANLYYTRMTGHGRTGAALAQATVSDWLNDAVEALEIGRRIGERVVVVGTSTGGTLAAWLALQDHPPMACVMISPNFEPFDHRADLLLWPWANRFVPMFFGATRRGAAHSEAEARYWTKQYPTVALLPMMGLVKLVRDSRLEAITTPTLVLYSRRDDVVDPVMVERTFARIGAHEKALIAVPDQPGNSPHVIAGDIRSPQNTEPVAEMIIRFLERL